MQPARRGPANLRRAQSIGIHIHPRGSHVAEFEFYMDLRNRSLSRITEKQQPIKDKIEEKVNDTIVPPRGFGPNSCLRAILHRRWPCIRCSDLMLPAQRPPTPDRSSFSPRIRSLTMEAAIWRKPFIYISRTQDCIPYQPSSTRSSIRFK